MKGRKLRDITPRQMDRMREHHDERMLIRHERELEEAERRDQQHRRQENEWTWVRRA